MGRLILDAGARSSRCQMRLMRPLLILWNSWMVISSYVPFGVTPRNSLRRVPVRAPRTATSPAEATMS